MYMYIFSVVVMCFNFNNLVPCKVKVINGLILSVLRICLKTHNILDSMIF